MGRNGGGGEFSLREKIKGGEKGKVEKRDKNIEIQSASKKV